MNRSIVWAGAVALALCLASAPASRAYAKNRHYHVKASMTIVEPVATRSVGSRVYHVTDDPSYDLSGTNHTLFLADDGSMYRAPSGKSIVLTGAGGLPTEVISIPASYRQDWMACAAGDRPVRILTPVGSAVQEPSMMSVAPAEYSDTGYREARPVRYTANHRRSYKKSHKKLTFTSYRPASAGQVEAVPADYQYAATAAYAVDEAVVGHELYQLGNSWYMKDGEIWGRAASWRGPYVHVKKGMVPREVREVQDAREDDLEDAIHE